MKKWKNPYLTLKLSRSASFSDIRKAAKDYGNAEEDKNIARTAKEELTQNVNAIFPAFLAAIDNVISLETELKQLRKSNQVSPKFSDEIKNDAFSQMGVLASRNNAESIDVDISGIRAMSESVNLKTVFDEISKNDKGSSIFKSEPGELKSSFITSFKIPQFIK